VRRSSLPDVSVSSECAGGYSGMLLAAQLGHVPMALELLKANPHAMNIKSADDLYPFDVALANERNDFFHCFLQTKERLKADEALLLSDPEGYYSRCLMKYVTFSFFNAF
jgi:hypothetical protein